MKKYDVIIIGFGPTGGTLANLLALHGFSILIIEKEKSFYLKKTIPYHLERWQNYEVDDIIDFNIVEQLINKYFKLI